MTADSSANDLLQRLFVALEDRHTLPMIEDVVERCRAELDGRAPRGAHIERLARQRLTDLSPTHPGHG